LKMDIIVAGIDMGSSTTKVVLLDEKQNILARHIIPSGGRFVHACEQCYETALNTAGLGRESINLVVSTGYGRKRVPFPAEDVTEITCHAKGVHFIFPNTRTVIDIGGQDSKVIKLKETGKIETFVMNDKCAAGTGRFLEVIARALEVDLNEMREMHLKSKKIIPLSNFCTVFAESEVISLMAQGHEIPDIIRGINSAVASRIIALMNRVAGGEVITLTGGVAKNEGVIFEMTEQLNGTRMNIPEEPQITGALGAALIALERVTEKPCALS
jgi:predicted CoA-substrate-specific enzyme activase